MTVEVVLGDMWGGGEQSKGQSLNVTGRASAAERRHSDLSEGGVGGGDPGE